MEELGQVKWFHCNYDEFLSRRDEIPIGTIIFCEDVGKIFLKTEDEEITDMSNNIEVEQ